MDPLTHLLATRLLIGRDRATLLAGIAPDLAFYSTYPLWVLGRDRIRAVLDGGAWPAPPSWMVQLHRMGHSIPIALRRYAAHTARAGLSAAHRSERRRLSRDTRVEATYAACRARPFPDCRGLCAHTC